MKARRINARRRTSAALTVARETKIAEHRRRSTRRFAVPRLPCAFLAAATGQLLKVTCRRSTAKIAEHFCVHPARRRWSKRRGELVDGLCTPTGKCSDWAIGIQPCQSCLLRTSRLLLPAGPS